MADYSLSPSYPSWQSRNVYVIRNPHNMQFDGTTFSGACSTWSGLGVGSSPYQVNDGEPFLVLSATNGGVNEGTGGFSFALNDMKVSSVFGYDSQDYNGKGWNDFQYIVKGSSNSITNYGSGLLPITTENLSKCVFAFVQSLPVPLTVDLTELSGWSDVTAGSHFLTIKAKAPGYADSELSEGVTFTKT